MSNILLFTFSDIHIRHFLQMAAIKTNDPISHDLRHLEQLFCYQARLKLDGASGCGVTRYREELRILVKYRACKWVTIHGETPRDFYARGD